MDDGEVVVVHTCCTHDCAGRMRRTVCAGPAHARIITTQDNAERASSCTPPCMLLSSRTHSLSTLLLLSLRPTPLLLSRSISLAAAERSEELLGKYITERKKYETPNPFKNITPMHGKTAFDDEDVYTLKPNTAASKVQEGRTEDSRGEQRARRGEGREKIQLRGRSECLENH